jgi:inner membrane protein
MPSPLAHSAVGYVVYRTQRRWLTGDENRGKGWLAGSLVLALGFSLAPDADSLVGFAFGDLGRYHNTISHSLIAGVAVALVAGVVAAVVAMIAAQETRSRFGRWFLVALLCYEAHVIMDFFTVGRGVMLFWPFSVERFISPVKLFYGLHWSDGWLSARHLWTFISEFGFITVLFVLVHLYSRKDALFRRLSR